MADRNDKGVSHIKSINSYISFDVETTGLDPDWDDIIEVGAVKIEEGEEVDRFEALIDPHRKLPTVITDVTGISDEMLAGQPDLEQVIREFVPWMGDSWLLGHNVNFDINFVYDAAEDYLGKPLSNDFVDTLRMSRYLFPGKKHHRLRDLIVDFDIAETQEHRALSDAVQTMQSYEWMKRYVIDKNVDLIDVPPRSSGHSGSVWRHISDMKPVEEEYAPDPDFAGRTFMFTGALEKMLRVSAQQLVLNRGGLVGENVTKKTNVLVLGNLAYSSGVKDGKSGKWKKAEKYLAEGQDIEIVSENVFYDMLGI